MQRTWPKKLGLIIAFWAVCLSASAQQMATIPLNNQRMPSDDLIHDGRMLRPDEAYRLAGEGIDLSLLNPAPSALWDEQLQTLGYQSDELNFNEANEVKFSGALLSASGLFRFNVEDGENTAIVHLDKTLHTM